MTKEFFLWNSRLVFANLWVGIKHGVMYVWYFVIVFVCNLRLEIGFFVRHEVGV